MAVRWPIGLQLAWTDASLQAKTVIKNSNMLGILPADWIFRLSDDVLGVSPCEASQQLHGK